MNCEHIKKATNTIQFIVITVNPQFNGPEILPPKD